MLMCSFSSVYADISKEERTALIAFYNATYGDTWSRNNGWKTKPLHIDGFSKPGTENKWYGIEINSDTVNSISLLEV